MVTPHALASAANLALGVFLFTLAWIVLRRSPARTTRVPLAAFLLLVGANYSLDAMAFGARTLGLGENALRYLALATVFLDPAMLLLFSLVAAYGAASRLRVALVAAPVLLIGLAFLVAPPPSPYMSQWSLRGLYLAELAVYYLLAFSFLLDGYLRETRSMHRERLGSLVVAFGLVCLPRIPLLLVDFGVPGVSTTFLSSWDVLAMVAMLAAMLGLVLLVVQVRTRDSPIHEHARRHVLAMAGLCAVVGAEWLLLLVPGLSQPAFAVLFSFRWFLFAAVFAAAMQRHDLLDLSDQARPRVQRAFAGAIVSLAIFQLAAIFLVLPNATLPMALGGSIGVVLVGAVGYGSYRAASAGPPTDVAWRRQMLYRAHVELGAPAEELARLRERLDISEREARETEELVALERAGPLPSAEVEEGRTVLDRYEVRRFLGAGSFGRTFLAWDRHTGDHVVLKELLDAWRHDPEALARIRREGKVALRVHHPNLVGFRGIERTARGDLLVLEYVEGETLRARLARGPLDAAATMQLARDLLGGLGALHEAGIVHLDVKPENIVLRPDGCGVLLDFGAATQNAGQTMPAGGHAGTRAYMAPEQAAGDPVGPRADLYAAAATLWEARAGKPQPHGDPGAAWRGALTQALQRDPSLRPPDANALLSALGSD